MRINEAGKAQGIVNALSDEYSRRIIATTISEAKSPEQISEQNGIPVSTCYRKMHDLVALSILQVSKIEIANGKKSVLYKSTCKNILVKFASNELAVEVVPNTNSPDDNLAEMWKTVRDTNVVKPEPSVVKRDCDICHSNEVNCKVFLAGDSKSYLSVCGDCEKRMHERATIKAVENVAHRRIAQSVLGNR
jgi:hypothetical protein